MVIELETRKEEELWVGRPLAWVGHIFKWVGQMSDRVGHGLPSLIAIEPPLIRKQIS